MKKHLHLIAALLVILFVSSFAYANVVPNNGNSGINVNILESRLGYTKIEYTFQGYDSKEILIEGKTYLYITAPNMTQLMEKGKPELINFKRSLLIPDNSGMTYRIVSQESEVINTLPVMPSKGHFTRNIDPNSVPYTFGKEYQADKYFPENNVSLETPYIIRDFRGMTIQFNPLQYNPVQGKMKVTRKMVIEVYSDNSKQVVNPLNRQNPLTKISEDFVGIYSEMFMNYGIGGVRFNPIPEPGKMLVICPTGYMTAIQPFVQWKQQRGLNVTLAEYPAVTGSGNTAIKNYIQAMYNSAGSVTYVVLVGDAADIPTLNGTIRICPV